MSNKDKAKLIITRMIKSGHAVIDPSDVDLMPQDDIDYIVANYEYSYITNYNK